MKYRSEYIVSLKSLHSAGSALLGPSQRPLELPVELLRYVDDGGNPDTFIKDTITSAVAANQAVKGKADAFR